MILNEKSYYLFKSTRGLKQGDPLSPIFFIIVAEVLIRGLNSLTEDPDFKGYGLPKWSPKINQLAYVDDTILFGSGDRSFIIKMMQILKDYEDVLSQRVNKGKSSFYLHDDAPLSVAILTSIKQANFPFTYLGCLVYFGRGKPPILKIC